MFSWPISRLCFRNPESRAGHRFWFSVVSRRRRRRWRAAAAAKRREGVCLAAEKRHETHAAGSWMLLSALGIIRARGRWWQNFSYGELRVFRSCACFSKCAYTYSQMFPIRRRRWDFRDRTCNFLTSVTDTWISSGDLWKYPLNVPHGTQPDRQ